MMNQDTKVLAMQFFVKTVDLQKIVSTVSQQDIKGLKTHLEHVAWVARASIEVARSFELAWDSEMLNSGAGRENNFDSRGDSPREGRDHV